MNGIEYIKNAIKEGGGYLIDNKNKIQAIIDLLEDDRSLGGEDNKIIKYAKIILDNLFNMEKKRIYRGIALSYMKEKNNDKIDNYVNSKEEAGLYGEGLVLEYEYDYKDSNIIEEAMRVRKEDVREYDEKIRIRNINGYRWYMGSGMYHYRIKKTGLRLKRIHYVSDDVIDNISSLVEVTRLYLGLSQKDFADKLGLKQSKISEYENGKRELSVDMITRIASLLDIEQSIKYKNTTLNIKQG